MIECDATCPLSGRTITLRGKVTRDITGWILTDDEIDAEWCDTGEQISADEWNQEVDENTFLGEWLTEYLSEHGEDVPQEDWL